MAESTVWSVMYPDGSRTVVGHYPLALAPVRLDRGVMRILKGLKWNRQNRMQLMLDAGGRFVCATA